MGLFWKDPNDEGSHEPFSRINLMDCITESVDGVSYDVCARAYSFLFSSMRPPHKTDKVWISPSSCTVYPKLVRTPWNHLHLFWAHIHSIYLFAYFWSSWRFF